MPKKNTPRAPSVNISKSGKSIIIDTGYIKIRRQKTTIISNAMKVHAKSKKLSMEYMDTPQFPAELGENESITAIISDQYDSLLSLITPYATSEDAEGYEPQAVYDAVMKIETLAKSASAFNNEYYGYVAQYYMGPKISEHYDVERTVEALKKNKFKIPFASLSSYSVDGDQNDYWRMKAWIIDTVPNSNRKAIEQINDSETLRWLMNIIENEEDLPEEYTQKYERKGTNSHKYRNIANRKHGLQSRPKK